MKIRYGLLMLFVGVVCVAAQLDSFLEAFPYADKERLANTPLEDLISNDDYVAEGSPLLRACPPISIPPDTNDVHQLKPGHIKVVCAMGDSITAAMSAKDTNLLILRQYRGISFACGGDPGVITMPNILQQFSPKGYPIGQSTGILDRPYTLDVARNGFNAAVSGAIFQDMLGQAQWLVNTMKAKAGMNMTGDWKVLTLWIGSNNLCRVCKNQTENNGDAFEKYVTEALNYIYQHVPRVFVNLMPNLDITRIYAIKDGTCGTLHPVECPCAASSNSQDRALVTANVNDYIARISKIAASFNARGSKEFAIVSQPCLIASPIYNRTFLSAADCFHPSPIGHQSISIALWNNMITPAAQKKNAWNPEELPICATESTMLYTN